LPSQVFQVVAKSNPTAKGCKGHISVFHKGTLEAQRAHAFYCGLVSCICKTRQYN